MSNWLDLLQWPAMLTNVWAAWLIASSREIRRKIGFYVFLIGNLLWALWGWQQGAWALIILQFCLAGLNIRGVNKNDPESNAADS